MSRYLRRIAAIARGAGSGIRPLVGSIYSASAGAGEAVSASSPDQVRPSLRSADKPRTYSASAATVPQRPAIELSFAPPPVHRDAETSAREADPYEGFAPLLPKSPHVLPEFPREEAGAPPSHPAIGDNGPETASTMELVPSKEKMSALPAITMDGLREQLWPLLMPRSGSPTSPHAAQSALVPASTPPDQIEIHIGRIEVTAVPPPVASVPVSRMARKSLDLGEYLQRGRAL